MHGLRDRLRVTRGLMATENQPEGESGLHAWASLTAEEVWQPLLSGALQEFDHRDGLDTFFRTVAEGWTFLDIKGFWSSYRRSL